MNKQQSEFISQNYKKLSISQLSEQMKLDRKEVQMEVRRLLAAQPTEKARSSSSPGFWKKYGIWIGLFLVLLMTVFLRLRLLDVPLERDEGEYAYPAQLLLQGVPPYKEAYDMRLPGIFIAYAGILAVFGQTAAGIHLGLLFVNLATILMLFLTARKLSGDWGAVTAAACYAVLSVDYSVDGFIANTEHFVILPAAAGLFLLVFALEGESGKGEAGNKTRGTGNGKQLGLLLLSGLCLGAAFLMKQHGAIFGLFAGVCVAVKKMKKPLNFPDLILSGICFSVGALLPYFLVCVWLFSAGVFDKFWLWTVTVAGKYAVSNVTFEQGKEYLLGQLPSVAGPSLLIWGLALLGLLLAWLERRAARDRFRAWFLTGLLLVSMIAVSSGLYFRSHYFLFLLPVFSLLCGTAVGTVGKKLEENVSDFARRGIQLVLFVVPVLFSLFQQKDYLFAMTPHEISRKMYGWNPFPESLEISRYIEKNSLPEDTVAVLGSEPQIFVYSKRHSASPHVLMYPLMEKRGYALEMQEEMIASIEAKRPKFMVFVNIPTSWLMRPESEKRILDWFRDYEPEHYERVGLVDIPADGAETQYYWDGAAGAAPKSEHWVSISRRKD